MAEEANNIEQPLSEYSNLETKLSTLDDINPPAGSADIDATGPGFGVDNKLDIPGPSVMSNVVGFPDNPPGSTGLGDTRNSLKEFIAAESQNISDAGSQNSYGKMFNYDAGPDGSAFYDRYAAYGDEKFAEVGFHPFRDNEANFNANTTMWNDWSRMLSHSFPTLLKRGFVDGPKSLGKMLTGDFTGADLEDAEEYERAAAIGQSSKEGGLTGFSAFMNNSFMNFGYTAGIITEAILEEVALSFVTGFTGGAGAGIQATRTAKLIDDIGKGLGKFKTGASTVKELIPKLSKPSAARTFWETSRGKALKTINPLENTIDAITGISKSSKAGQYAGHLASLSKTAGGFYRDVRNLNMAISESRLEAGMVENKIFKHLYDDHYSKFKKMPDSDEQYAMRQQAKKGSLETFYANAGIIYLTNQITFGNITNPKGGLNNFLRQTRKDIYEVGAKSGEKQFGKLGKVLYDNTKKAFVFEKNNLFNLAKSWWKQPGYATAKNTLGYFKANVSEGIQENLQEAIARANENHYIEAYKQQGAAASAYAKGTNKRTFEVQSGIFGLTPGENYWKELGKEFSSQGFETFMSGFMMGTFSKPLNNAIPYLSRQRARIFNKAEYQKWKETKLEVTKGIVDNLNEINVDQLINSRLMNLGTQEKVSDIQKNGSKKEALDAEVDSFVSTMSLMRRTGTTDVFIEKLKSMQELTDTELADAVNSLSVENVPQYRKRIDNAINKLRSIEEKFKQAEDLFENPVDLAKISADEMKTTEGQALIRLHNAWNKSVENFVYLNEAFEDSTKRMSSIYDDYLQNTSLATADYGSAKVLFKPQSISRQIGILEQEAAVEEQREDITKSEKNKNVKAKREQIDALKEFQTAQALFYGFYQRGETPTISLAKKRLKEDGIEQPSEEQIQGKLNELLGDITDEKKQYEVTKALKDAHDKYIRSLATDNNATVFQSSLDDAFNKLADYYKLDFESRAIAEHIDLLTDPGEFLKLVLENEKVFERLDEQRNQLNSELVDEEVNKVALDQLLNALANNAPPLYMDKNQVINLLKNKEVPEFFTGHKKEIYEPGSEPYRQGKELIDKYIELSNILTSNIDPVSGVEMTPAMKKSVEEIKQVFKDSKDLIGFKGGYLKDSVFYQRVSNVMGKVYGDYGYNRIDQIIKTKDKAFTTGDGSFTFTQDNINALIDDIKQDVSKGLYGENNGGINDATLSNLKAELESLLKGEVLSSYQKQIDKLEASLETVSETDKEFLNKQIEDLKTNKYDTADITKEVVDKVVRDVIPAITYEAGRVRGDSLDEMVRDFFDPQSELRYDNYKDRISEDAFISLFGETGYLTKLKERVASGDIYIFSKDLKISDNDLVDKDGNKLPSVAGALDLIIVDKTGKKYIVDLKTGKSAKWAKYLIPGDNNFDYKKYFENSMQQRAYSNLFYNNSDGQSIETLILPIALEENEDGFITKFNKIDDRNFRDQKPLDNIVDGFMFMKTDNKAKIKPDKNVIRVTDIDKYIPRGTAKIEETKKEDVGEATPEELADLQAREEDLLEDIGVQKRKANVDKERVDELEDELKEVRTSINRASAPKRTPEDDEEKKFFDDLNQRRRAAQLNIIETTTSEDFTAASPDTPVMQTEYVNNKGERIFIEKQIVLATPAMTDEQAKQKTLREVRARIQQLYKYDELNYRRKDLVDDTVDNLTGRVFQSEIGNIFDRTINDFGDEKAVQSIKIDSVYVDDNGNYGILARNTMRDKVYDMIVTPEGDIISHNNQGAIGDVSNPNVTITDAINFQENDFARRKTDEDRAKEKEKEKVKSDNETEILQKQVNSTKNEIEAENNLVEGKSQTRLDELNKQLAEQEKDLAKKKEEVKKQITLNDLVNRINDPNDINTGSMYDSLQELLDLDAIDIEKYSELKELIDVAASEMLGSERLIESGNLYTFKESIDSKNIEVGDQVRVQKINGSNKTITVKKTGRGNFKPFNITSEEFNNKIEFGDKPVKINSAKAEVKQSGDVLINFLGDKDLQTKLDNSKKNYLDDSNDQDIFNKCKTT